MSETPFGQRAREVNSPAELLALESSEGRSTLFEHVDVVLAGIMIRAMRGERVVRLARTDRGDELSIIGIPAELKATLPEVFQLEAQQARGAWFLPDSVAINARALLLPSFFRKAARYAHSLATEQKGKFSLRGNPDAMVAWSVLAPFADVLLEPVFMRVEKSGLLPQEEFASRWAALNETLTTLGFTLTDELRPFCVARRMGAVHGGRAAGGQGAAAPGDCRTA